MYGDATKNNLIQGQAARLTKATGGDQLPGATLVRTLSAGGSPYAGYAGPAAAGAHGPAAAAHVLPMYAPKGPEQLASAAGETCLRARDCSSCQTRLTCWMQSALAPALLTDMAPARQHWEAVDPDHIHADRLTPCALSPRCTARAFQLLARSCVDRQRSWQPPRRRCRSCPTLRSAC